MLDIEHYYIERGQGRTPRGERPFTIRQFAEDLQTIKAKTLVITGSHFIANKNPQEFNDRVMGFL